MLGTRQPNDVSAKHSISTPSEPVVLAGVSRSKWPHASRIHGKSAARSSTTVSTQSSRRSSAEKGTRSAATLSKT